MNIRFVLRQLGLLTIVLSVAIFVIGAMELLLWGDLEDGAHGERYAALAMLATAGIGLTLGGGLTFFTRGGEGSLGRREALLLVAVSWLFGAAMAGLPFYLWATFDPSLTDHPFNHFVDCYFEAMSGMTTTGATVLTDIDTLPKSLLLWRATTHWVGGLGIVVLFVAVLPTLGVGGKKLFQFEAPGPTKAGVRPRIRETARILWLIYVGLTIAEIIALRLCGMDWFESVCHTFATLATGGFSTKNASLGGYNSAAIDWVVILFMLLAGINFGLYYQAIRGRLRDVWKDPELRLYFGIIFVASVIVVAALMEERFLSTTGEHVEATMGAALRHGIFQVISIQTTTGFCTADFNQWGFFPKAALMALMFVGASAGSTGGGIKVIRILIAFKVMVAEVGRVFRPNVVRPVRVGGSVIDPEMRLAVLVYILGIGVLFAIGSMLLMLFESGSNIDFTTAATASAATLNNIGPGLARVGAVENFGWFSPQSKIVMCILMALGRLEVYAIFVLFVPGFWRRD